MYTNYTYNKLRREYGKQCRFNKCGPNILENLMPDPSLEEQWLSKNPINKCTNKSIEWSEHEVQLYFILLLFTLGKLLHYQINLYIGVCRQTQCVWSMLNVEFVT